MTTFATNTFSNSSFIRSHYGLPIVSALDIRQKELADELHESPSFNHLIEELDLAQAPNNILYEEDSNKNPRLSVLRKDGTRLLIPNSYLQTALSTRDLDIIREMLNPSTSPGHYSPRSRSGSPAYPTTPRSTSHTSSHGSTYSRSSATSSTNSAPEGGAHTTSNCCGLNARLVEILAQQSESNAARQHEIILKLLSQVPQVSLHNGTLDNVATHQSEIQALTQAIDKLTAKVVTLEERLNEKDAALKESDDQKEQLIEALARSHVDLKDAGDKNVSLQDQKEQLIQALARSHVDLRDASGKNVSLQDQLDAAFELDQAKNKKLATAMQKITELEAELADMQAANVDLSGSLQNKEAELDDAKKSLKTKTRSIKELRAKLSKEFDTNAQFEELLGEQQGIIAKFSGTVSQLQEELAGKNKEVDLLANALAESKDKEASLQSRLDICLVELEEASGQNQELRTEISALESQIEDLHHEQLNLKANYQSQIDELREINGNLKFALAAAEKMIGEIEAESGTQLTQLRAQLREAQESCDFKEELLGQAAIELNASLERESDLESLVQEANRRLNTQKDIIAQQNEAIDGLEEDVSEAELALENSKDQIEELEEKLRNEKETQAAIIRDLQEKLKASNSQVTSLQNELATDKHTYSASIVSFMEQLEGAQKRINSLENELSEALLSQEKTAEELLASQENEGNLLSRFTQASHELGQKDLEIKSLQQQLESLKASKTASDNERIAEGILFQEHSLANEEELASRNAIIQDLQRSLDALQSNLDELGLDLTLSDGTVLELQRELAGAKLLIEQGDGKQKEIDQLKALVQNLQGSLNTLRLFAKSQNDELRRKQAEMEAAHKVDLAAEKAKADQLEVEAQSLRQELDAANRKQTNLSIEKGNLETAYRLLQKTAAQENRALAQELDQTRANLGYATDELTKKAALAAGLESENTNLHVQMQSAADAHKLEMGRLQAKITEQEKLLGDKAKLIEQAESEIAKLTAQINTQGVALADKDLALIRIEELDAQVQTLRGELTSIRKEKADLDTAHTQLQKTSAESIRKLQRELDVARKELATATEELQEKTRLVTTTEHKFSQIQAQLVSQDANHNKQMRIAEKTIEQKNSDIARLEKDHEEQLKLLQGRLVEQEQTLAALRIESRDKSASIKEAENTIAELQAELKTSYGINDQLQKNLDEKTAFNLDAHKEIEKLKAFKAAQETANNELELKIIKLEKALASARERLATIMPLEQALTRAQASEEKAISRALVSERKYESQLEASKRNSDQLQAREAKILELQEIIQGLREDLDQAGRIGEALLQKLDDAQARINQLNEKNGEQAKEILFLKKEIERLKGLLAKNDQDQRDLQLNFIRSQAALEQANTHIGQLQEENEQLQSQADSLESDMDRFEAGMKALNLARETAELERRLAAEEEAEAIRRAEEERFARMQASSSAAPTYQTNLYNNIISKEMELAFAQRKAIRETIQAKFSKLIRRDLNGDRARELQLCKDLASISHIKSKGGVLHVSFEANANPPSSFRNPSGTLLIRKEFNSAIVERDDTLYHYLQAYLSSKISTSANKKMFKEDLGTFLQTEHHISKFLTGLKDELASIQAAKLRENREAMKGIKTLGIDFSAEIARVTAEHLSKLLNTDKGSIRAYAYGELLHLRFLLDSDKSEGTQQTRELRYLYSVIEPFLKDILRDVEPRADALGDKAANF